jgi:cephalosporin-C deacetylase-like acetyl esterase
MFFAFASAMACGAVFAAGELEDAVLHGETDKARAIDYRPGEEMVFTLSIQGAKSVPEGKYFIHWTRTGDDGVTETGKAPASLSKPLVIKTKLDKPGFVRLEAVVKDAKGKAYRKSFKGDPNTPEGKKALNRFERMDKRVFFDGGAGVMTDTLQSVPEPKDFDEFWAKRKARLAKVPMNPVIKEHPSRNKDVRIFTFTVSCAGPRPVTGQYTMPAKPGKYPAQISFHGYGAAFVQHVPSSGPSDRIAMFINAHGYELEREPEYYKEFYNSIKSNGRTFGLDSEWQNKSVDTAYFGWMCYRIMRALQFLKTLPEWNGKDITATGGSMGGLQTVWAAGLDPDVTVARPGIPWCCDMGGRVTLKRLVSGWSVQETEALRYFDPVNLAKRISKNCKVEITRAGLGDYCCPPSGVAILYNNIPGPKKINWVQGSTHGYVPPEKHQAFSLTGNGWTE